MLACEGLVKSFGGFNAVDGIELSVAPGERVGIAGANGAGKSTLFGLLAGALAPTAGTVRFNGQAITGRGVDQIARLGMARTFQSVSNAGSRTVMENACLSATYAGSGRGMSVRYDSETIDRALEALQTVGLLDQRDAQADRLSMFDQRRLMLATATASAPKLLLLDEPVGGLRPNEVAMFAEMVEGIAERGVTVLAIEHVIQFLVRIAPQRIMVMHQGSRLAEGTAEEIAANPLVRETWLGDVEHLVAAGGAK